MIHLAHTPVPDFGMDPAPPLLPPGVYVARLARALERMRRGKLDFLAIYADREHFAHLAYLTGFDPRFEEALLLLAADGRARLMVGNECMGYLPDPGLGIEVERFQDFSLMGQPRGSSRPLRTILRSFGIKPGARAGAVGYKVFCGRLVSGGPRALDVPSYLADLLRDLCGGARNVLNAAGLFADAQEGLRVINEPEQIAQFEYASCVTSEGVRRLLRHLRVGVREQDLEKYLDSRGLPLSCHRMVGFGEKAKRGLASPSARRAKLGDAYTTGFGVTGALTCRAGVVARTEKDLPPAIRAFYPRFAANYFAVVAAWYEGVRVGAVAGEVFRAAERVRDRRLYDFAVNPGHYLHLDEWLNSPFAAGSRVRLRSGMMIQMDVIPVSRGPFCCVNAEDGIVLADDALQAELARRYPTPWQRILRRREFMRHALGIRLHDTVLPLSNIPGWLPPYALGRDVVFARR
jgi:hypothetical protein